MPRLGPPTLQEAKSSVGRGASWAEFLPEHAPGLRAMENGVTGFGNLSGLGMDAMGQSVGQRFSTRQAAFGPRRGAGRERADAFGAASDGRLCLLEGGPLATRRPARGNRVGRPPTVPPPGGIGPAGES